MNCAKCPHHDLIARARAACLACDPDKVSHHGVSHVEANDFTLSHAIHEHTPAAGVTSLPPDIEDTMRRFLATLFAQHPLDILLVSHLVRGTVKVNGHEETATLANFRTMLGQVATDIEGKTSGPSSRTMAFARYRTLVRNFGVFRSLASGMIGRGHAGPGRPKNINRVVQMELEI